MVTRHREGKSESGLCGLPRALRDDVRLLGGLLGQVIGHHRGSGFVKSIEEVRRAAKAARQGRPTDWRSLSERLVALPDESLTDIARGFNQFLNLANIAEQRQAAQEVTWPPHLTVEQLSRLRVDLVLTAHPTEVLRRTLIRKYDAIAALLHQRAFAPAEDRPGIDKDLSRLIAEAWHSDEIRRERPTPQEEARWGFAVVESSLWHAVPDAMRDLDAIVGTSIPPQVMPFTFSSWMGGDRDGNPNVTAAVTREVLLIARWVATDLMLGDVNALVGSLSMTAATPSLRRLAGNVAEPYRAALKALRTRLENTKHWIEQGGRPPPPPEVIQTDAELLEPLERCFESLNANGMESIAQGPLLDTLRRAKCFGVHLVRLDIRQNAAEHTAVLDDLTRHLSGGDRGYAAWRESRRCSWLLVELNSSRPIFPPNWPADEASIEVIETFRLIATSDADGISAYVISMATTPSDVLAVALLLKKAGLKRNLPIVPLFESLEALNGAAETMDALLAMPWYRSYVGDHIQVMIGYSDSAKDAGRFAAAWALYRAQDALAEVAARRGLKLTLFHGRGGTVGRGGGPAEQVIRSQPPGSVVGSLRVTEQGEMIRFRLGTPAIAKATLSHYLSATLTATVAPPPAPSKAMREMVDKMAAAAYDAYKATLRATGFANFFRKFTPEPELSVLALGSRPAQRSTGRGIEGLRAIPWVFAWTQVRLMLPAWLGTESALACLEAAPADVTALRSWPFFAMQLGTLESVLANSDPTLARYYARRLTNAKQQAMAEGLIERMEQLHRSVLALAEKSDLLSEFPEIRDSITVRNTYLDPLHLLQAELLARRRKGSDSLAVDLALKVTMAGIASGLRSTG